jgi:hypothetical protein
MIKYISHEQEFVHWGNLTYITMFKGLYGLLFSNTVGREQDSRGCLVSADELFSAARHVKAISKLVSHDMTHTIFFYKYSWDLHIFLCCLNNHFMAHPSHESIHQCFDVGLWANPVPHFYRPMFLSFLSIL